MSLGKNQYLLLACLFSLSLPGASARDDQHAPRDLFEKVREQSDIKAKGMPGYLLRGDVRVWVKKNTTIDGKYLFVWTPEGNWKEQIAFPGYQSTRIGDEAKFSQVRSTESESPSVFELRNLIGASRSPRLQETDKPERGGHELIGGVEAECFNRRISATAVPWSYCFDSKTDDLLKTVAGKNSSEVLWKVQVAEFSNFQEWEHKRIPLTLKGFNGKNIVVEIHMEELKPLPPLPPEYFVVPKEATSWANCHDGNGWKIKNRVSPAYPPSARMQHQQGIVVLYAIIGENGHLSALSIAQSATPELNQSALAAVSQWTYERTPACSSSQGSSETLIDVIYSLNL